MLKNEAELAEIKYERMIIEHEKNMEIIKVANEAEEKQKVKISREIHDGVASILTAVTRSIDKFIKDSQNNNFDIERLKNDLQTLQLAKENLRNISHDLIPPDILAHGFIKALKYHLNTINDIDGSIVDFENKTEYTELPFFTKAEELNIFRICLEIINNLLKHANYHFLKIVIEIIDDFFQIDFIHDGEGLTMNEVDSLRKSTKSVGLNSIYSRALFLGASIIYNVEHETSFITIKIPINS